MNWQNRSDGQTKGKDKKEEPQQSCLNHFDGHTYCCSKGCLSLKGTAATGTAAANSYYRVKRELIHEIT